MTTALVGLAIAIVQWPWAAAAFTAGALGVAGTARVRERRAVERAVAHELPEVIELLRVCTEGGLSVRMAVEAVVAVAPGGISGAMAAAARAASAGASFADALEECTQPLGPAARPIVSALAASERYGVPLVPTLERLGADARADERRRGEAHARKVPVRLLFPLVLCILPAFALLTVAPLIAGGLESLRLP
jgi:tight adherence protein C